MSRSSGTGLHERDRAKAIEEQRLALVAAVAEVRAAVIDYFRGDGDAIDALIRIRAAIDELPGYVL